MARQPPPTWDSDPQDDEPEPLPTDELTTDSADPGELRERKRRLTRAEREAAAFWAMVFASPVGRREMWRILNDDHHAFTQAFKSSPVGFADPLATWYERGRQDLGLVLYHRWLAAEPEGVRMMHAENDIRFPKPRIRRYRKADPE